MFPVRISRSWTRQTTDKHSQFERGEVKYYFGPVGAVRSRVHVEYIPVSANSNE